MSLSDCPKCWDTPCTCDYDWEQWSLERLKKHREMIDKIIVAKSLHPPMDALAYAVSIIEQYEMDARAIQDKIPGYCQGSIYRGAIKRIDDLRKGEK